MRLDRLDNSPDMTETETCEQRESSTEFVADQAVQLQLIVHSK